MRKHPSCQDLAHSQKVNVPVSLSLFVMSPFVIERTMGGRRRVAEKGRVPSCVRVPSDQLTYGPIDPTGLSWSHEPGEEAQSQNGWLKPWQRDFDFDLDHHILCS
jgi:hypothetical protein